MDYLIFVSINKPQHYLQVQDHKKYSDEKTKLDVKLIKAFDEKQTLTKKLAEKQKIKAAIEKECRALQAERAAKAAQR